MKVEKLNMKKINILYDRKIFKKLKHNIIVKISWCHFRGQINTFNTILLESNGHFGEIKCGVDEA